MKPIRKLGKGRFGDVYAVLLRKKGQQPKEVAVKRRKAPLLDIGPRFDIVRDAYREAEYMYAPLLDLQSLIKPF